MQGEDNKTEETKTEPVAAEDRADQPADEERKEEAPAAIEPPFAGEEERKDSKNSATIDDNSIENTEKLLCKCQNSLKLENF